MSSLRKYFLPAVAGTLILSAVLRAQPMPRAKPGENPDAIVVGAGISGLSAAWELAQGGAKVTLVDMASIFGGHAVMATGDLCMVGTPAQEAKGLHDSPDIAFNDFVTWGEDPNRDWVRYYVNNSRREIYDWVTAMGVGFEEKFLSPAGNSVLRTHRTKGRGLALVSPIYRECLRSPNLAFVWNTRLDRLLRSGEHIDGLVATNIRTGEHLELHARVVVLATGGFQSNLDLVREFWPANLAFPERFLVGSGLNSVGSGLKIAQAAGAVVSRLDHQWNYVTGLPDPRFPEGKRGLNAYNDSAVWVNADGQRFIAERTSAKYAMPIVLQQKGGTYWAIFDETTKPSFWVAGSDWADFSQIEKWIFRNPSLVKSADSIEALATRAGLPPAALTATVRNYNAQVAKGVDTEFGRFGPGKIFQPKAVATPPFYAVQFFPLTRKSMGGVVIDTACRVQDAAQHTIPGLYAAGELTGLAGINGKAGLEGTFLGPSIVTGRVAGRAALAELGRTPASGRVVPAPVPLPPKPDPLATNELCLKCHELPKLIATPRPGYWHFEKVHAVVVEKNFDCTKCHAELTPTYLPDTHKINRLAQVEVCANCHKGEDH